MLEARSFRSRQKLPSADDGSSLPWSEEGSFRGSKRLVTSFTLRIPVAETQDFNLSFYTNSVDQGDSPLTSVFEYPEVFGRDVEFLVTDVDPISGQPRRQHYRVSNNAPGVWVTFAVHGVAGHQIRVKLRRYYAPGTTPVPQPVLSAIAFDPYDSRRTTMGYDEDGNLTQVVDPLNNTTVMGYI